MLDKKKNRHSSMPNPSNQMAVDDIKRVQEVIARESKQLVYTHYNIVIVMSINVPIIWKIVFQDWEFIFLREPITNWNCLLTHSRETVTE